MARVAAHPLHHLLHDLVAHVVLLLRGDAHQARDLQARLVGGGLELLQNII